MGLKPWTMSFKENNPEELILHNILGKKTSPMAFAKDVLIEVLVRGKYDGINNTAGNIDKKTGENREEIDEILDV